MANKLTSLQSCTFCIRDSNWLGVELTALFFRAINAYLPHQAVLSVLQILPAQI